MHVTQDAVVNADGEELCVCVCVCVCVGVCLCVKRYIHKYLHVPQDAVVDADGKVQAAVMQDVVAPRRVKQKRSA